MLRLLLPEEEIRERAGQVCQQRVCEQYLWPEVTRQLEHEYLRLMGWDRRAIRRSEAKFAKAA
jgi:hypothetical protein